METLNLTLRQRKLLHILQDTSGFTTGQQLASELNVSPRTIRSDVVAINTNLAPHNAKILSERSKGYLYQAEDPQKIKEMNRIDTAFFTKEDRVRFLSLKLCLSDEPLNLYDLEDEMFVSHTTLMYDLHALKLAYVLNEPNIRLIQSKNNISFEQDEKKIRTILLGLFHDGWDYNDHANAFYGYQFLGDDVMELILDEIPVILRRCQVRMDDPSVIALELSCAIMYHRCRTGHSLPVRSEPAHDDASAWHMTEEIFRCLEKELDTSFPAQEKENIYLSIASSRLSDMSRVTRDSISDYIAPSIIRAGDRYLQKIDHVLGLDFSTDDDFYITLLFYLRDLHTDHTIFNKQGNLNVAKEALSAELEIAWLFQEIALEQFGHVLSQTELIYLAHCISGALEFYFVTHPDKKLRTVLCCHRNMPSAWALKRQVLGAFSNYLEITDLIPVNTKNAFDFSDTDLILSTVNKNITDRRSSQTLTISYLLTPSDLSNISNYIQHHRIRTLCPSSTAHLDLLFQSAFWHECASYTERFPIIEALANDFIREGIATEQHLIRILKRESVTSYVTRPGLVFLHTLLPAEKTQLSFVTLDHRIMWNGQKIRTVVMAMFREEDRNLLFWLKYIFNSMNYDIDSLKMKKTRKEITDFFLDLLPS